MSAAILLPLLIYILITVSVNYRDARRATDRATLALAADLSKDVAARLQLVGHSMRILATIRSIDQQNWAEAQSRSREIANLDPYWRNVALIDLERGVSLFDLRTARPVVRAIDAQAAIPAAHRSARRPMFSGVTRGPDGRPEIEAYLAIDHATTQRYLLRVSLDPSIVQQVLMAANLPDGVSAVVDRRGLFIARSKAWPERLGTPATSYVRDAIVRARSGLYRSITWEKLRTQTAFATIAQSGWSVHVAVPSSSVDRAQSAWELWSFLAALASLSFAALLVFLAQRVIEERRVSQVRAQQAERLEAVGKLTGGIAHDFNNMLAIVIGSLDLANRRLAKGNTDVVRYIDNAMEGARRAADLTRRLLAFSRRQPLAPAPVNVNALIRSMQELLSHTLSGALTIKTDLADDLWLTFVDPGQLENAIVNLAINARDAMPDGGMLRIETSNRPAENGGSGNQIGIVVGDTGSGMTADVAARAFEPFFTTKEVGRGTGLGLSQIHGFAVQSGGDAIIASIPGEGTAVTILLPRYVESGTDAARPHIPRQDETAPAGRADEIILIVEDEDQIRLTNVEALRSLGYTVRHAANAEEALAVFQTQPGIRLLLSDIVMPGMNGRELADRVSQAYPNTRILLVTGFERDQDELDESRILRKPFGIGELARRVRDTFDSPPTET
ncbi:response regulator [Sphingomonas sp. Tas61C01]|uniref:response regulator n=1 Tax=Sphingomonas sp. Tas61C01 TaxID=3458297 RepID=UPI00403ED96D